MQENPAAWTLIRFKTISQSPIATLVTSMLHLDSCNMDTTNRAYLSLQAFRGWKDGSQGKGIYCLTTDLSSIYRIYTTEERTNSCTLSSDLHTYTHPHTPTGRSSRELLLPILVSCTVLSAYRSSTVLVVACYIFCLFCLCRIICMHAYMHV